MKRWLVIICLSLISILFIYPSAFIYGKDTLPDNNDDRLIAYIIGQVQQNITSHQPLYYGTYFAPDKNTLTYSDPFITSAVLTLPFRTFTHSPILLFNIALVVGFLLTIISSFILFDYLFQNDWISALAVILFNFSGFHLAYFPHIQMFLLWPLLLALYFFLRFHRENGPVFLTLCFLATTFQMAESLFPVYLIFFTVVIIYFTSFPSILKILKDLKTIFFRILPFLPLWAYLLFPYLQLRLDFKEAIRPIRDAANFSLGVDNIFTSYRSWTIVFIFSILTMAYAIYPKIKSRMLRSWNILFLFSLIMSLGPVLKIFGKNLRIFHYPIPLPYAVFYYLFPGFTGFRTPSRFIVLALLAAVILIGYNIKPFFAKLKSSTKLFFILFTLTLIFIESDLPLKAYPVNINMHPVYEQVKSLPKDAIILELPIKLWVGPDHEIESIRSLYSLEHRHRRFNGFSGFSTNSWIELTMNIQANGLDKSNLARLHTLGITHVIENNTLRPLPN